MLIDSRRNAQRLSAFAYPLHKLGQDSRFIRNAITDTWRKVEPSPRPWVDGWDAHGFYLTWLGQSTVLIQWGGVRILTDPALFPRIGPHIMGMTFGPKRWAAAALEPEHIGALQVVLISHAHMDHLDFATLCRLQSEHIVIPLGDHDLVRDLSSLGRVHALDRDEQLSLETSTGRIRIVALEVNHPGSRWRFDRHRICNGYVLEARNQRLAFVGDTAYRPELAKDFAHHETDVAIMPIGTYNPWRHRHCTPEEAACMAQFSRCLLPIHWNTFQLGREPRREPIERFKLTSCGQARLVPWEIGDEILWTGRDAVRLDPPRTHRILVTECHLRFGFNIVRSLTRAGYVCVASSPINRTMCRNLSGVLAEKTYPLPFQEPEGYVEALNQAAREYGCSVLVPGHEDIFVLARFRHLLPAELQLAAPAHEQLLRANDKRQIFEISRRLGIPVPDTFPVRNRQDLIRLTADGLWPCVLKPSFGEGGHGQFRFKSKQDFESHADTLDQALASQDYLLQQYVPGLGAGIHVLRLAGRVVAVCGHIRLRELPTSGGTSTARLSHVHPKMREAAERLLEELDFEGIAMIEFRYQPHLDQFHLLEVNPRYWGSLATAIEAGVDFPRLHVRALLGGELPDNTVLPRHTIESRWLLGEIFGWFDSCFNSNGHRPMTNTLPKPERVIYEDFQAMASGAFFAQIRAYLMRLFCDKKSRAAKVEFFRSSSGKNI